MKNEEVVKESFWSRLSPVGKVILVSGVCLLAFIALNILSPIAIVPAGHKGVLLEFGKVAGELPEGLSFKIPLIQSVSVMSVQTQKYEVQADAASLDLQDVQTTIALNYRVDEARVLDLYRNIGVNYQERIIAPAIQESAKAVMASYDAESLIVNRPQVKAQIKEFLQERLNQVGVEVMEVSIVNFQFSAQFDAAIESKQTAQQDALRAKNDLERVKMEAEQKIVQAQAEAESLRIQNEQLAKSKDVLALRFIEKWDGRLPLVVSDAGMLLDLPSVMNASAISG